MLLMYRFYSMMSFVNPGLLGCSSTFQRIFIASIEASQDATATPAEISLGNARSKELSRRIAPFLLRRSASINEAYLPPCHQYVVFCRPAAAQITAYRNALYGPGNAAGGLPDALRQARLVGDDGSHVLSLISSLRQICNHASFAEGGDLEVNSSLAL
jgi:DNA repair and recombination protein RAD54B